VLLVRHKAAHCPDFEYWSVGCLPQVAAKRVAEPVSRKIKQELNKLTIFAKI
jgi:hypothetical protein